MKSLNKYINETLACSHGEHINEALRRSRGDRINEWKASTATFSSINKKQEYFIYKIYDVSQIRIFNSPDWSLFNRYRNKVYINGEHIELDNSGYTKKGYKPGEYKVEIKGINDITYCGEMFKGCKNLKSVPLFNTSKVLSMNKMFSGCSNLEEVPEFDTSKVTNMSLMFYECHNLNQKTKEVWSTVYDFEIHEMKK